MQWTGPAGSLEWVECAALHNAAKRFTFRKKNFDEKKEKYEKLKTNFFCARYCDNRDDDDEKQ